MQPFKKQGPSVKRGVKLDLGGARAILALGILAMAVLVGARSGCSERDAVHRPYTFTYVKSGGFVGIHETLVVDSEKRRLTFQSRRGELKTADADQADLEALEDKLNQADFINIKRSYRCTTCADHFVHDATLQIEGESGHNVHWEDHSGAPPGLIAIEALSGRLIRENFEPMPPRLGPPVAAP